MSVLAVNTAFPACNLALVHQGELVADMYEPMVRGLDARLAGLVSQLFDRADMDVSDLTRIVVIIGPGSFTGVRVGVAFARGLALALTLPCLGLTSLEASVPLEVQDDLLVTLPARKRPPELTFWAQHVSDGLGAAPPVELSPESLKQLCGKLDVAQYPAASPETMAAIAALKGQTLDPAFHPPAPAYVRLPDAVPMKPAR